MEEYEKCPYCKGALRTIKQQSYYNHDMTSSVVEITQVCKKCNKELDIADWYESQAERIIQKAIDDRKPICLD